MSEHDFEKLRAERNAAYVAWADDMRKQGWQVSSRLSDAQVNACYCACGMGGPCEHQWNGEPYESADGSVWSATCSRCGMTSMSHSLRTAP